MGEKVPPRLPAGMRDILPDAMIKRQYVLDVVRSVFEEFGFEPLQTPAVELSETLLGKYGEDAEKLIFKAWYGEQSSGELSLRYDLSVPLCRVVAMNPDLPRPFKRYQLSPVWRAERPQKGRYREFFQCDVDIVGTASMAADAEIVAVVYETLRRLGFSDVTISINNRKILDGIGEYAGVPVSLQGGLYRSIDKYDKIGLEGVRRELMMVGVPAEPQQGFLKVVRDAALGKTGKGTSEIEAALIQGGYSAEFSLKAAAATSVDVKALGDIPSNELQAISTRLAGNRASEFREFFAKPDEIIPEEVVDRLLDLVQVSGPKQEVLDGLEQRLGGSAQALAGITELRDLFAYLEGLGVPDSATSLNFVMVRGLEYYTGPIFETIIKKPKVMPSITGGGRFDNLIGIFAPTSLPATGTSLGIERIIDAMDELDMFPPSIGATTARVLVTIFSADTMTASLEAATRLRQAGIYTSLYYDSGARLGEQIGYASAKGIPYVVIAGPDEVAAGNVTLRKLGKTAKESEQRVVALAEMVDSFAKRKAQSAKRKAQSAKRKAQSAKRKAQGAKRNY